MCRKINRISHTRTHLFCPLKPYRKINPWHFKLKDIFFHIYMNFQSFLLESLAAAAAKSLQSCPTLCNPIDGCPPGFPIPGILWARILEWVAISFSNAWKWKVKVKSLSHVRLLVTPWTAAYQAPPSMGFSRQKYWSGVPLPSPEVYTTLCLILLATSKLWQSLFKCPSWS